jgi:hypothetical protein
MADEEERKEVAADRVAEDTPPAAPDRTTGEVAVEEGQEAPAHAAAPDVETPPEGGGPGVSADKGGGIGGWFASHRMLTGVGIGIMAVVLIVAAFSVGYAVGRPDGGPAEAVPFRQVRLPEPERGDLHAAPTPDSGGAGRGRLDILVESRGELMEVIAAELGVSTDELQDELTEGKTIAEVAEEKGASTDDLTATVAAKIGDIAEELAADGEISAQQAEKIKAGAEEAASRLMERGHRRPLAPPE